MTWGSLDIFLAMGGYGLYVWGSYCMLVACILLELLLLNRSMKQATK